jgi:hypothetical protein
MNTFYQFYKIIWSIFAIGGGTLILLFRDELLKRNARLLEYLYERTHFILFKHQAEGMETAYMRVVATVVAIGFVMLGLYTLIHNIL